MPGSLLHSPPSPRSRVSRHESTRSDRSDGSNTSQSSAAGKKVSFSKAVRVKKYSRPKKTVSADLPNGSVVSNGSVGSPEKRFWFKVYKNKHRQSPDPKELSHASSNGVIYYDNDVKGVNSIITRHDGDVISYHPNPSPLNYPILTSECSTQTPPRDAGLELHALHFGDENITLHPSQMPTELPHVKRNHVKKIVNKFNEEAILTRQRSYEEGDISPPSSPLNYPRHHSTPIKMQRIPTPPPEPPIYYPTKQPTSSKLKRNPIVNGVKVIFGMGQLKKKDKSMDSRDSETLQNRRKNATNLYISKDETEGKNSFNPYRIENTASDNSETETKTARDHRLSYARDIRLERGSELVPKTRGGGLFSLNERDQSNGDYDDFFENERNDEDQRRRGKFHVETWDSGNQLVFDTTDVNTSSAKMDNGELFCTVGEKHQLWQNNKRMVVVEEPSPIITRRKAKSQSDLTSSQENYSRKSHVDKGVSTEHLSSRKYDKRDDTIPNKPKDSWLKLWTTSTKDKGVQCSEVPTRDETKPEEIYAFGKYKVVKPRNGVVSAYSNVPSLEKVNNKTHSETSLKDEYNTSGVSSSYRNGDIYSIIDKTKKKKSPDKKKTSALENLKSGNLFKSRSEPLYIGPPPKTFQNVNDDQQSNLYDERGDRKVKTSRRSFGFRLTPGREEIGRKGLKSGHPTYQEENWYDIDDDLEAAERRKVIGRSHRDMSEVRQELAEEEFASDVSSSGENRRNEGAGSVIREVDYKKREISYENVPRSDGESNQDTTTATNSGLWFRDAEEDYRREMAQSEVSYPAGSHVGSDRFHTVSRTDKAGKQKAPPSPRAYTLDRRHFKEQKKKTPPNTSGVKILVNGKEVNDKRGSFKKNKSHHHTHRKYRANEDPSSVQSDPLYVRGGLAAAYQARQRAAVRRSNSSVAGIGSEYRQNSPLGSRRYQSNSEMSGASSETESAHARRPLVMYIPGISHRERSPDEGDRSSGVNVARSQSMMTSSRPTRITSKSSKSHHHKNKPDIYHRDEFLEDEDKIMPLASESAKKKPPKVPYESRKNSDIKRRHSMPKDTKFSWLKWKIKGKPSREP